MPYVRKPADTTVLRQLAAAARAAERAVEDEVARLRQHGASWSDIGEALGVTRQSAWGRYSSPTGEHPDKHDS